MGEQTQGTLFQAAFNCAVRVEAASTNISADAGAILIRQGCEVLDLRGALAGLRDPRCEYAVRFPQYDLVLADLVCCAQGWHDQDDLDALRNDPVMRVAMNSSRGQGVLDRALPSQPTMSRLAVTLADDDNRGVLASALLKVGLRRAREDLSGGRMIIDFDSFPIATHGHQKDTAYNGHYHKDCYHPLIATSGAGDILAVMLRPGNVHTAKDVRSFIEPVLKAAVAEFGCVWTRFDAGFASGDFFDWLDEQGVRFVTRLKSNGSLKKVVDNWFDATVKRWRKTRQDGEPPREATYEFWHKAGPWTRQRRVVAVLVERNDRKGEMFENLFFLCTNAARPEATSAKLLEFYRQRGRHENTIGEFVGGFAPNLSLHDRDMNEADLCLAALAYNVTHLLRRRIERVTKQGLSMRRLRERVLKTGAQLGRHARSLFFRISAGAADTWRLLGSLLAPDWQAPMEVAA